LIERATGKKALRHPEPPQLGDVPLTWAEISKAERLLGYRPVIPLAEGLLKFVEWYRAADSKLRA
jgi:UDP-glucuronate 4-epimerase